MTWHRGFRELDTLTEQEARAKVASIIEKHKGKTLLQFLKIYSPPNENDYSHYYCISEYSGINLKDKL